MAISLYTITTDPSSSGRVRSEPITIIEQPDGTRVLAQSADIPSSMSQIAFSHFMDVSKAVEYLNLGRKLGSSSTLDLASGKGKPYAERITQSQKELYLRTTKSAFLCFLSAAKCANVSLIAWNKLRRVLEAMMCVQPWQSREFYNQNGASGYPVKAPLWATSADGIWRNSIANVSIGTNTWMPEIGLIQAGDTVRARNAFPTDKLGPTTPGVGPHVRFGMYTQFLLGSGVSGNYEDEGLRHLSDNGHLSSIRLRTQAKNFSTGDAHPFWFDAENNLISVGYGDGRDPYPATAIIAANAPLGYVDNVNQEEGHIPGVRGVPGIMRDFFEAEDGTRHFYEACGTPPLEWYTRLFYAKIPGLAPGVEYQSLFTDVMQGQDGMSLADYILTIGIESWVAEIKVDATLNTRDFIDAMGSMRYGADTGLYNALLEARAAAPSADPGSATAISAAGAGITAIGGTVAASGIGLLPGAIIASAGVVASLTRFLVEDEQGHALQVIAEVPRDVYGYMLAKRDGGSDYVVNPTAFLAFRAGGSLNEYLNRMYRSLNNDISQPAAIIAALPSNIQQSLASFPNASNRVRPVPLDEGFSPLLEKSTIPEGQTVVSIQRPLGAENVIVSLEGNVLETGDLIKSGKYDVSFAANGAIFSVVALKFKSGQSLVIRTPIPSGGPMTYRDESEENSIVPWIAAAAAVGAGVYWYQNGGKETVEEWRKRMG